MYKLKNFDFQPVEGIYKIFENTSNNKSVSIKLATKNNKAVVYLKDFSDKSFRKVAEFDNPTKDEKEKFFENQLNYWQSFFMEIVNQFNISEMLDTNYDCSFYYYYKYSIHPDAPIIVVTISSESGFIYFSIDDVKNYVIKESRVKDSIYLDLFIKKALINFDIECIDNF